MQVVVNAYKSVPLYFLKWYDKGNKKIQGGNNVMCKEKKGLKKVLLTLAVAWLGVHILPSADCVQAANVTISTDKSSITMDNAGLQGSASLEVSVENAPVGATTVISLGDSQVAKFYKEVYNEKDERNGIELYTTKSETIEAKEYDEEEDDDDGIEVNIIPLTTGKSSVVINVYSSTKAVLATKTIPVEVRKVTPKLCREDHAKNKKYTLAQTSDWSCECGDWVSGNFYISNVPYGSKVTLAVSNNKMYKYINSYDLYKWKKMSSTSYVLKENPYPYGENYDFSLCPVKTGKATITVTIESGAETTTFVINNKVISYKNPLSKLVINGKNKTKAFNKEQYLRSGTNLESSSILNMYSGKSKTMTGQIKMKKGYKLVSVKNVNKKIKLTKKQGSYYFTIKKSKLKMLKITYKDKKGKTRYLYNNEV